MGELVIICKDCKLFCTIAEYYGDSEDYGDMGICTKYKSFNKIVYKWAKCSSLDAGVPKDGISKIFWL